MTDGKSEEYRKKYKMGTEYQDFISDKLLKNYGIVVGIYSSEKYQKNHGESASGIEIKFDNQFAKTGNLYFEISEKSKKENAEYVPSGIFRKDNSWLYLIGNYSEAFLFSKVQLQRIYYSPKNWKRLGILPKGNDTSQAFIFPIKQAISSGYCLKRFEF